MKLKAFTLILAGLTSISSAVAEELTKSVIVDRGASLASQIQPAEKFKITNLIIKGDMSPDDCNYLVDMCRNDSCAITELSLPWLDVALTGNDLASKSVKKITYDFFSYMPGGSFNGCPNLEEVIFTGPIGHIDGGPFNNCPKLKTIRFCGPVFSTGGPNLVYNCPELETISIEGIFYNTGFGDAIECPKFKGYDVSGIVVQSFTDAIKETPREEYSSFKELNPQLEQSLFWIDRVAFCNSDFHQRIALSQVNNAIAIANSIGRKDLSQKIDSVRSVRLKNRKATYLDLLKSSKQYVPDFKYASASDSLLTLTREYFNLDSVAGDGDDISKIKNLLYWVHDLVRHDGSSLSPNCKLNLRDLYEESKRENRGYNCRNMAIMLNEALLAEGIPARYVTCQSRAYDLDNDCHVINVAWSESLGKWVWIDPTYAAFVTDENGVMLHPGEVRERLIDGRPLVLNEDANWNHETKTTKEEYLENYMAKNLYIMSANTINQSEPEGMNSGHEKGGQIYLVPEGFKGSFFRTTNDSDYFWQKPR